MIGSIVKYSRTLTIRAETQPIYAIRHPIIAVRQLVPAVWVAEGIDGEPLAETRAVVAEEKRMAEAVNERLAGEERVGVRRVAEGRHGDGGVSVFALRTEGRAEDVVEHDAILR